MRRFADETTVHGIREAYYANRGGRLFWVLIFVGCCIATVFQLEGLFESYVNESVGTRVTHSTSDVHIEAPAFYFCNTMWMPNLKPFLGLLRSSKQQLYTVDEFVEAFHVCSKHYKRYSEKDYVKPKSVPHDICRQWEIFWRETMIEQYVNGFLIPVDPEVTQLFNRVSNIANSFTEFNWSSDPINQLERNVNDNFDGSLHKFIQNLSTVDGGVGPVNGHGILDSVATFPFPPESAMGNQTNETSYFDASEMYMNALLQRSAALSLNFNGVCWKVIPKTINAASAKRIKHVVLHTGGAGYRLRKFAEQHDLLTTLDYASKIQLPGKDQDKTILEYVDQPKYDYATFVSLGRQNESQLSFDQSVRVSSKHPLMLIKIWTQKISYVNRKQSPCRYWWTELDQAHCNQRLMDEKGVPCEHYLPQSLHYPETKLSNKTCLNDFTGYVMHQPLSNKRALLLNHSLARITPAEKNEVLSMLARDHTPCPRPCSRTKFLFDVMYESADALGKKYCTDAMAALLTPAGHHKPRRGPSTTFVKRSDDMLKGEGGLVPPNEANWYPCSVVEFEQTETHGMIFEEYPLYTPSDLAANLGGTMGLWIGASVISLIQAIYVYCIERLFVRFRWSQRTTKDPPVQTNDPPVQANDPPVQRSTRATGATGTDTDEWSVPVAVTSAYSPNITSLY